MPPLRKSTPALKINELRPSPSNQLQPAPLDPQPLTRLRPRDSLAAAALLLAAAAVVLWQNAHLCVLWDASYTLDTSFRIALGQMPYRDFPLVHSPLTFLLQAAIMRLTGRVFFHHVLYAALVNGLAAVLAWRIILRTLDGKLRAAWLVSLLLALPLIPLGVYSILPFPSYDCDTAFSILLAIFLLQRLPEDSAASSSRLRFFLTGAALPLPLFFKQNIGLPFLAAAFALLLLLILAQRERRDPAEQKSPVRFAALFAGAVATLLAALLLLHLTAGVRNYLHWTIQFASERRLPGLRVMLAVYADPSLSWTLPCVAVALILLRSHKVLWARIAALCLLAAPFLWTLAGLFLSTDADDRADSLLALWPLLLILAAALALWNLCRRPTLRSGLPILILAAIHGTFLSQQLWGSTYSIWPLLILLIASLLATLPAPPWARPTLSAVISVSLLIAGGLYAVSHERLNYTDLNDGPVNQANLPALQGLSARGPYLANFEQLVLFAARDIPPQDPILLLPGEDPFYFATGRTPQFPVVIFDNTTDPYSPEQLLTEARTRHVRWIIWKTQMQSAAQPLPDPDRTLALIRQEFVLDQKLPGYDIYRRR